jgi:hypothetical protein
VVRIPVRRRRQEAGQAIVLTVVGMSLFMLGALGFIIDGSHLYAQRVMAQAAADAAAQAGMMSIFNGTSGAWGGYTGSTASGTAISCSTTGMSTAAACVYARAKNGFNLAGDTVTVIPNPSGVSVTGLSTADTINLLEVKVQRQVNTTLMGLLGASSPTISAVGIAAIVQITSPTPILITHPTASPALSLNGSTSITICGGPSQSIQVNSSAAGAYDGGGTIDLSHAGPADSGTCTTGTGANFGVFGGPASSGSVEVGTTGRYVQPSSPIQDPLAGVAPPAKPTVLGASAACTHCGSCPQGLTTCTEYTPGLYPTGLNTKGVTAMLDPGIYYLEDGGFSSKLTPVGMCASCPADPTTVNGVLLYDTVTTLTGTITASNCDATGGFAIDTKSNDVFMGAGVSAASPTSAPVGPYYGIALFEDRNACAQNHTLGQGNSQFSVIGTVYITNTRAAMLASPGLLQSVEFNGGTSGATQNIGQIIVGAMTMKGGDSITMQLLPTGFLKIRQVALVD